MTRSKEEAGAIKSPEHDSETPLPASGVAPRQQRERSLVPRFAPGSAVYFYVFNPTQRRVFGVVVEAPEDPVEDYLILAEGRLRRVCWAWIGPA